MRIPLHGLHINYGIILAFSFLLSSCYGAPTTKDKQEKMCRCENYKYDKKPFVALWNSPTIGCDFNFSTPIDLAHHGIYENYRQTWDGNRVSVFAGAQLGLYPYYSEDGSQVYNGGLPQLINLQQHLQKARMDIERKIPDPNFNGLAVIDWEPWRPLWETNWNKKRIYKVRSVENVRQKYPNWPLESLITQAKREFETAGRSMFESTINLGKQLRPKALWGFYGFPDCYSKKENRYQCSPEVRSRNDKLDWLYEASTALFPSMYLLEEHPDNRDYVLGRLRETLRFVNKNYEKTRVNIPVFVYHRNIYEDNPFAFNFLTKKDLDNTIGLAAGIGASGVVIWGNRWDENTSPQVCQMISEYVQDTLGPYIQTKMKEIESCSASHCNNEGHCIDRSLLTTPIVKAYEENAKYSTCSRPRHQEIDYKRDTVLSPDFSSSPFNSSANKNLFNKTSPNSKLYQKHNFDASIMDDFFRQLNGTTSHMSNFSQPAAFTSNVTSPHTNFNNRTAMSPPMSNYKPTAPHIKITRNGALTNSTRLNKNYTTNGSIFKSNTTRTVNGKETFFRMNNTNSNANSTLSLHSQNQTQHHQPATNMTRITNVRKSEIPHPPVPIQKNRIPNHPSNQKKTDVTSQILSGMSGNIIRIADLFPSPAPAKRDNVKKISESKSAMLNTSNKMRHGNNSRKSEIYQSSGGHLPLMSSRKNSHSWLPHIYVILIGVSLGGALMFSLIFIGAYYYISLRNTFPSTLPPSAHDSKSQFFASEDNSSTVPFPPQAHSSPKGNERRDIGRISKTEKLASEEDSEGGFFQATSKLFSKYRSKSVERKADCIAQVRNTDLKKERIGRTPRAARPNVIDDEVEIDINSLR